MLGVTRRSVDRWIEAYRVRGIEGLRRKPPPGRRPKITGDQRKAIVEAALKSPRAFGYLRNEWSVRLLAEHLSRELGIKISKSLVWLILKELGIAYKRPKAVVRSQDPDYEEKEKILAGYKNSASDLLKRGLPWPLRTKRGSSSILS